MAGPSLKQKERQSIKVREPSNYRVIIHNDNVTPMEFVVDLLVTIFRHSTDSATKLMMTIHTEESAVAGTYTYEVAEQKAIDATMLARGNNYPLVIKIEEEQ